ncbi:MAG: Transposase DDE domain protein [Pelotomaculum sp. PtaB.Bin104]|nr:MAG: Transposase DDE domain protein [Pelotomaculum sp. PtaB.Bin104]
MDKNRANTNHIKNDNKIHISLNSLIVRPIASEEEITWNNLMQKQHYLGFQSLTGETLKYVALLEGQWVALIGWGSAVLKSRHREKWVGWSQEQKTQRLKFTANNQRFLILSGIQIKNLASKVLALNMKRLPSDWLAAHGHPVLLAETFVDHSRFSGTCYRAAGWIPLGKTSGYGRKAGVYYYHGETKTIFVKPLHKDTRQILSAPFLSTEYEGGEKALIDLNSVPIQSKGGLLEHLARIRDPRKPRGIRHGQVSILAVAICALLSGAKSFIGLGEWAADLSQELLKRLSCRYSEKLRKYVPPSEPTLRRTIQSVNADEVDRIVGEWLAFQSADDIIAVDGKVLRGSKAAGVKPVHLVSALLHHEQIVIGQQQVDRKSNEIKAFKPLLEPLDLKGKLITADAMQTQVENARFIVKDKSADYIFPVKQNQGNLFETIRNINEKDFSPST